VARTSSEDGAVAFGRTLPFLPFYVPKDARPALDLVPLEDELNRFRLQVAPGAAAGPFVMSVDGKTAGTTLWEAAQFRWKKHFEAWRVMGLQKPSWMMPALPSYEAHVRAERDYA